MSIKHLSPLYCAAALLAALVGAPVQVLAAQDAVAVQDYDLFVDPPTAFAFIKLPTGWKFIGKLDAAQMDHLPPGTLTSLLPPDESSPRLAGDTPRPVISPRS